MGPLLAFLRATRLQAFNDRRADFRAPAATILQQENCHPLEVDEARAVNDRSAVPFRRHQTGARKDPQMSRQRVLRYCEKARQFAGREPIRLMANQRPERVQTRPL